MSGETLSFLIADDHPMVRDALASALGQAFAGAGIAMAGTLAQVQSARPVSTAFIDVNWSWGML